MAKVRFHKAGDNPFLGIVQYAWILDYSVELWMHKLLCLQFGYSASLFWLLFDLGLRKAQQHSASWRSCPVVSGDF